MQLTSAMCGLRRAVCARQEFAPDLMLGEAFFSCSALLASRLDIQWVSYFPAAPMEPFLTSVWPGSNRRAFTPNPLSYYPQMSMTTTSQFMVRQPPPQQLTSWSQCCNDTAK